MLKWFVKMLISTLFEWFYRLKFLFVAYIYKKRLVIFDIDNTLGDTWPTLNNKFTVEKKRYLSIPIFERVSVLIFDYMSLNKHVLFITARPYKYGVVTREWLNMNGFDMCSLVLVATPQKKILLLKKIKYQVDYYDDLSLNHENGEVKFYDDEIKELQGMRNVNYFDYHFLKKLQVEK